MESQKSSNGLYVLAKHGQGGVKTQISTLVAERRVLTKPEASPTWMSIALGSAMEVRKQTGSRG